MRTLAALALLTMGSPLPAMADGDVYRPPTAVGAVAVYRGGAAEAAPPVTIHRGSAIRPAHLAMTAHAQPTAESVGGRNIWLVDRADDQLISCRAINTTVIGRRRIGCTRGRMPD